MNLKWFINSVLLDTERMEGFARGGFMLLLLIGFILMAVT